MRRGHARRQARAVRAVRRLRSLPGLHVHQAGRAPPPDRSPSTSPARRITMAISSCAGRGGPATSSRAARTTRNATSRPISSRSARSTIRTTDRSPAIGETFCLKCGAALPLPEGGDGRASASRAGRPNPAALARPARGRRLGGGRASGGRPRARWSTRARRAGDHAQRRAGRRPHAAAELAAGGPTAARRRARRPTGARRGDRGRRRPTRPTSALRRSSGLSLPATPRPTPCAPTATPWSYLDWLARARRRLADTGAEDLRAYLARSSAAGRAARPPSVSPRSARSIASPRGRASRRATRGARSPRPGCRGGSRACSRSTRSSGSWRGRLLRRRAGRDRAAPSSGRDRAPGPGARRGGVRGRPPDQRARRRRPRRPSTSGAARSGSWARAARSASACWAGPPDAALEALSRRRPAGSPPAGVAPDPGAAPTQADRDLPEPPGGPLGVRGLRYRLDRLCRRGGPAGRRRRRTRCATRSRRTCSTAARTCGSSRSCSGTRAWPRRRSIPTSRRPACGAVSLSAERAPDGRPPRPQPRDAPA